MTALARRVWIVAAPRSSLEGLNDEETLRYIAEHFRLVFEGYNTGNLFLGESRIRGFLGSLSLFGGCFLLISPEHGKGP